MNGSDDMIIIGCCTVAMDEAQCEWMDGPWMDDGLAMMALSAWELPAKEP